MRIAEIMSTRVRTVAAAASAELAWDRMRMHQIHHLVVVHDSQIVGIITERDLGSKHGQPVREGRFVRDLTSPAAAKAAASSCRTCCQAMPPSRRRASVNPFSESPGSP
jgi:CBS-domain-containing membrane protein